MKTSLSNRDLDIVRHTALFGGLSDKLLTSLLKTAILQNVMPGEILFMQSDDVEACFVVLDGWVKIYRLNQYGDEAVIGVFSRGQSFGEAAVFSMSKYPATAEAVTEAHLLRLPRGALVNCVRQNPQYSFGMLASTSQHLHDLVRQIEQLKTNTGTQRVARFLASLCPVEEGSCTIGLPYDKALIANRLGMKPESLSRAFARLRNVGVRVEQSSAAISDVKLLRGYADYDRNDAGMLRKHER